MIETPPEEPSADEIATGPQTVSIPLWDLPLRLVHWGFALLLPALWGTWFAGMMPVHRVLGYVALGLLLFRIYWGFAGSRTARFATFVRGPAAVARYLSAKPNAPILGHNPLGALSVVALLALLGVQIGLGLIAQDVDGLFAGPLAHLVEYETSDAARELHETIFYVLLGFVALHLAAILFYLLARGDNLVGPMVTGRKRVAPPTSAPAMASIGRAATGVILSSAIAVWIAAGAPIG
jgi:cytochrome b